MMPLPLSVDPQNMVLENLEGRMFLAAVGPMSDDRFEPNDSMRQVSRCVEGAGGSANFGALEGERVLPNVRMLDARDIFRIELTATGGANDLARIKHDHRKGNLDLRVMNADGEVVRQSVTKKNNESVSLEGLPAGEYFIQIVGRAGAKNGNYRLVVNIEPKVEDEPDDGDTGGDSDDGSSGGGDSGSGGGDMNEDAYEANNDSIAQVRGLAPGAANSANLGLIGSTFSLMNLKLSDSHDIYRFELGADRPAHACVRIAALEAMNLILFNSAGNSVALADAYNGVDTIMLDELAAGEYFVHVSHYALENPSNMDYALTFTFAG